MLLRNTPHNTRGTPPWTPVTGGRIPQTPSSFLLLRGPCPLNNPQFPRQISLVALRAPHLICIGGVGARPPQLYRGSGGSAEPPGYYLLTVLLSLFKGGLSPLDPPIYEVTLKSPHSIILVLCTSIIYTTGPLGPVVLYVSSARRAY